MTDSELSELVQRLVRARDTLSRKSGDHPPSREERKDIFATVTEAADALASIAGAERISAESRMLNISGLVAELNETREKFGDSCVYIRRGGLSWGAVALNREAEDKKHSVFDLQAAHDRECERHAGQVKRLIESRNAAEARAEAAERALAEALATETEACAEIADCAADEKDVMAMECVNDAQVASYREGERTANQIAARIRARAILERKP